MEPLLSLTDFEALMRRSGMVLTEEQVAEIYTGWGYMELLLNRLHSKDRGREAEPAHLFDPEQRV
jgi:hypothetical protein